MAGRGTDIKLGPGVVYEKCKVPEKLPEGAQPSLLYPSGVTKCCIDCADYDPETGCADCFKPKIDPRFPALGRRVCAINAPCGLHIIGTERHEARRIDNQLRGRSGRQGDPGSSRFALSLEDELLKMFMSEWMLKMMERLGFTEGSSLEDKRLTRGIERAQRKVEERNFSTRKHLLEWDEPMDFQRKEFYTARQRLLERRRLQELIFDTIDNAIDTTLQQYLSGHYERTCIAEWCRTQLEVTIEEDNIDTDDLELAQISIREQAKSNALEQIRTSLGEYIDPDEPPAKWDVGGLLHWAQRAFKLSMTQNQLRKMEPEEIEEALITAAERLYDEVDLDGIALYLDPNYPHRALADWARGKFGIDVNADEFIEHPRQEIRGLLDKHIREAYRQREVSYPVEACIERAFGDQVTDQAAAAGNLAYWVNSKFRLGWTLKDVQGKTPRQLRDELVRLNEEFFHHRLEEEIDRNIEGKERAAILAWGEERFPRVWDPQRFAETDGDLRSSLLAAGREMLRWELTQLEQFVLLRIYDQAWKDHLLEMDHLKTAVMQRPLGGDQTHPQSQFAIEGRGLFRQMWARIANRVTDIIFKVRISGSAEGEGEASRGQRPISFMHADATGAGFAAATADQAAALRAQGVEGKVATIRREAPKIGRNDPCPCGSGKKYKQCHGKKK